MPSESSPESGGSKNAIPRSGDSLPRRVFEDILKQTAALSNSPAGITSDELELLLDVARRLHGVEFQCDPVVVELVRVILQGHLKETVHSQDQVAMMASRIAHSLYDNPESEARLRSLWKNLSAVEP